MGAQLHRELTPEHPAAVGVTLVSGMVGQAVMRWLKDHVQSPGAVTEAGASLSRLNGVLIGLGIVF